MTGRVVSGAGDWVIDRTAAVKVAPTSYEALRCYVAGHALYEDGPDRRVCDHCGLGWIRAAEREGGEPSR